MDLSILYSWQMVSLLIVAVALIYTLFIKDKLAKNNTLTTEQLAEIDAIIARGVVYAQNLYISDNSVDVKKLTIDYVLSEVKLSKIVPDEYMSFVETIINSKL